MGRARQDTTAAAADPAEGPVTGAPGAQAAPAAAAPAPRRDPFVDFVRAFSLLVVVAWHWVFTIIVWRDDGPHATNPIGFTRGLFLATWLLQVMPLFFFVGGFAHTKAWQARATPVSGPEPGAAAPADSLPAAPSPAGRRPVGDRTLWRFARERALGLIRPALVLAGVWWLIGNAVVFVWDVDGIGRAVRLILSPLWFLCVYVVLIALFPIAHRLHQRFGPLVLVWAGGLAALVDVARFAHDLRWVAWVSMVVVWGLCHQLGFFWEQLVALGRRVAWMLTWSGLFGLAALVGSGLYPGSMVGVPGERFSNMAPPTLCIVTLVLFQAGIALLLRPWVLHQLESSRRWSVTNTVINRFSLPLFLFHSTGMAVWAAFSHFVLDTELHRQPDAGWWLSRPFSFVGPLLATLPIILLLAPGRGGRRRPRGPAPAPASGSAEG